MIALASISLEQNEALEAARRSLRSGVLELLLAGEIDAAREAGRRLWGDLPTEPVRLALASAVSVPEALLSELELFSDRHRGRLFFAERADLIVVIVPENDDEALLSALAQYSVMTGISAPVPWRDLTSALAESHLALARAGSDRPVVRFDTWAGDGVLGLLERSGAHDVARRVLSPLVESGRADIDLLLDSAATWLRQNGAWDPAARQLGVHRHTLRARITAVETALGLDLGRFEHRAELWVALEFDGTQWGR